MRVVPCLVVVAATLAGCGEDLGTCDISAATQVVYAVDGTPYYAGQALVQYGCAEGVCHSSVAVNDSRKGAPHGLNFDLRPLSGQSTADNIAALRDGVTKVRDEAGNIYSEISAGTMPPGDAGARPAPGLTLASGMPAVDKDGQALSVSTDVGKATVRNWLACNAPVVSGVTGAVGDAATIPSSALVPARVVTVGSTFESVYKNVLAPCASACHKAGGAFPALDLSQDKAYSALVGEAPAPAPNACAGKNNLVTPGSCETSLLYTKLTATPGCGAQMPLGGAPLPASTLDSLCEWIKAGAKQ